MRHGLLFGLSLCAFSLSAVARTGSQKAQPVNVSSTTVDEVLSPVRAILQTRDARGSEARTNLLNLLQTNFLQLNVCGELLTPTDA